jgi:hypothetical protein
MDRENLRRVLGHLKRALRMEQRLTVESSFQKQSLITGRMIQVFYGYSVPDAIVEVTELANRFRETPQTIKDALRLLRDIGRADPADLHGCWKLQLAWTLPSGREGFHLATAPLPYVGWKNK